MERETFFKTENLTVGYDNFPLIKDINITGRKGEIITLIGPNGAGKSTILKSITRHLSPITGVIYIDDDNLKALSGNEIAKKMSVVLTNRITTEMLTCYDVVSTGRYPHTNHFGKLTDEDKLVVDETIARVGAESISHKDFNSISDGQRQKIMLARAIAQQPQVIVLDEPTSFLDIKHKIEILNILCEMARIKGITVVMSLHEIDLASKISDTVICVKGDTISRIGTPEEIFTSEIINELYDITDGSYNTLFGSVEFAKPTSVTSVFVMGGGGEASCTYRLLQKKNIAFSTGIIYENDVDFQTAKALSADVYSQKAFIAVDSTLFEAAKVAMDKSNAIINPLSSFGELNEFNTRLIEYAIANGKKVFSSTHEAVKFLNENV